MPDTTISPNMNLPVPVPSEAPGPDWANDIVADMYAIDSHDHTSGKGVPITPDGLDISADLPMGSNNLTEVRSVNFTAQASPIALSTDLGCIYVSGADLYYNDEAGNQVRITQGGAVTGATGTITGLPSGTASASYSAGTFTFQSATSTPATMAVGPLVIGRSVASSKTVTLSPNSGQASNFGVTFPAALPGATNYTTLDASGNLSFNSSGSTGSGAVVLAASPTLTGSATVGSVLAGSGSSATPSFSFSGDTDTGVYNSAGNKLGLVTGGTLRAEISSDVLTLTPPIHGQDGAESSPTYGFTNDTTTGIYSVGTGILGITTGGTLRAQISSDTLTLTPPIHGQDGAAGSPTFGFSSDTDTGIYRTAANSVGVATGGTAALVITATALTAAGSIETASGGAFKTRIYTGSVGASGSVTLANPGTVLYGVSGMSTYNGGSNYAPMQYAPPGTGSTTTDYIKFDTATLPVGSASVALFNYDSNSTNSYRVIMFYL